MRHASIVALLSSFLLVAAASGFALADEINSEEAQRLQQQLDNGDIGWMPYVYFGIILILVVLIIAGLAGQIRAQRRATRAVDTANATSTMYQEHLRRSLEISERNLALFEQQVELLRQIAAEVQKK
ncbi:MAG: hypothetical protein GC162_06040 [Planctomycetes bacterium]|nr:hypothetical protein [Planctomycetota bacterium]